MRVYASALYMMQMILYTAVAVYAPALALSDGKRNNHFILSCFVLIFILTRRYYRMYNFLKEIMRVEDISLFRLPRVGIGITFA